MDLAKQALLGAQLNSVFDVNELSLDSILRQVRTEAQSWIPLELSRETDAARLSVLISTYATNAHRFLKRFGRAADAAIAEQLRPITKLAKQLQNHPVLPRADSQEQVSMAAREAVESFTDRIIVQVQRAIHAWIEKNLDPTGALGEFQAKFKKNIGELGYAFAQSEDLRKDFLNRANAWISDRSELSQVVFKFLSSLPNDAKVADWLEPFKTLHREFIGGAINRIRTGKERVEDVIADVRSKAAELSVLMNRIPNPGAIKVAIVSAHMPKELQIVVPDPALVVHSVVFQLNDVVDKLGAKGMGVIERLTPTFESALVESPALKRMKPQMPPFSVKPFEGYVMEGFSRLRDGILQGVQLGVFAEIQGGLRDVGSDIRAAVIVPAMSLQGLSREIGSIVGENEETLREVAGKASISVEKLKERLGQLANVNTLQAEAAKQLARLNDVTEEKLNDLRRQIAATIDPAKLPQLQELRRQFNEGAEKVLEAEIAIRPLARLADPNKIQAALKQYTKERLDDLKKGLDIGKWLGDVKVLGSLSVANLLQVVTDAAKLPKMISQKWPDRVETTWNWNQPLKDYDFKFVTFKANGCRLELLSQLTVSLPTLEKPRPDAAKVQIKGGLLCSPGQRVTVTLFGVVGVSMEELRFKSGTEIETEFKPLNVRVQFLGALDFVATLQEKFKQFFRGRGLLVDVGPTGVDVGLELRVPPISFGVFSLSNISFSAALGLPFGPGPTVFRFAFCSPENRFLLSVAGFSGSGYLGLEASTSGGLAVEGALEFGGCLAFSAAVASGSLYIFAGIYFRFSPTSKDLAGFVRAGGRLDVLGIITVSIEVYLGLTYHSSNGESVLYGRAELKISIKIGFFKKTVSVEFEKTFSGSRKSGGSPVAYSPPDLALPRVNFVAYHSPELAPPGVTFQVAEGSAVETSYVESNARNTVRISKPRFRRYMAGYRLDLGKAFR